MSIQWERDMPLGKELLGVIEDYELETGHEVQAINIVREPVRGLPSTPSMRRLVVVKGGLGSRFR